MRRCIYHTDLGQNAVFHNFSRQIALSQYSGRSIMGCSETVKKNLQNHLYGHPVLTFDERQLNLHATNILSVTLLKWSYTST